MSTSKEMIELLVSSLSSETADHDVHLFREALKSLARKAQEEQLGELERDFNAVYNVISGNRIR